jgi:hypothetical protein
MDIEEKEGEFMAWTGFGYGPVVSSDMVIKTRNPQRTLWPDEKLAFSMTATKLVKASIFIQRLHMLQERHSGKIGIHGIYMWLPLLNITDEI